jgi:hypothetical protein
LPRSYFQISELLAISIELLVEVVPFSLQKTMNSYIGMCDHITKAGSKAKHDGISGGANTKDGDESNLNYKQQNEFGYGSSPKKPLAGAVHNPDQSGDVVDAGCKEDPPDQTTQLNVLWSQKPQKDIRLQEGQRDQENTANDRQGYQP